MNDNGREDKERKEKLKMSKKRWSNGDRSGGQLKGGSAPGGPPGTPPGSGGNPPGDGGDPADIHAWWISTEEWAEEIRDGLEDPRIFRRAFEKRAGKSHDLEDREFLALWALARCGEKDDALVLYNTGKKTALDRNTFSSHLDTAFMKYRTALYRSEGPASLKYFIEYASPITGNRDLTLLMLAIIQKETNFGIKQIHSNHGRVGIAGVPEAVYRRYRPDSKLLSDPDHFEVQLEGLAEGTRIGALYLMELVKEFDGVPRYAVAAYKVGPEYVHKHYKGQDTSKRNKNTKEYVGHVFEAWKRFGGRVTVRFILKK